MNKSILRVLIREHIMSILTESLQPEFSGILKVKPSDPGVLHELQSKLTEKFPDLKPLSDDKLHVTLLHQSLAKPLKKVDLPPYEGNITFGDVYLVEREGKKSTFVVVNEQEELKNYVESLSVVSAEPTRTYHVSLTNLTGNPMDSVGHTEQEPIMSGAKKIDL